MRQESNPNLLFRAERRFRYSVPVYKNHFQMKNSSDRIDIRHDETVVISGASGRFPSSANFDEFRDNLFRGVDMVTADDSRWPVGMSYYTTKLFKNIVSLTGLWNLPPKNGKMPNLERFDEDFFGIPESQVNLIDPQERLQLELTYEAIVDAGKILV